MIKAAKKLYHKWFIAAPKRRQLKLNLRGNAHTCNICSASFRNFLPFRGGKHQESEFIKRLNIVGSDLKNFKCPACGSFDRERHLYLYFDALNLWEEFSGSSILHIAPEEKLSSKIITLKLALYIKGDLYPKADEIECDITRLQFENEAFDFVICNHVLEHVAELHLAFAEIYRVLKKGGKAILQTPYSARLTQNFEEPGFNTEQDRLFFFGQEDHVRVFSENQFFNSVVQSGFKMRRYTDDVIVNPNKFKNGVNPAEPLMMFVKE